MPAALPSGSAQAPLPGGLAPRIGGPGPVCRLEQQILSLCPTAILRPLVARTAARVEQTAASQHALMVCLTPWRRSVKQK